MLLQQENNHADPSYHAPMSADKAVDAKQPVLALQVGAYRHPGIRRKYRTNEDTILITQGYMPSVSTAPKPSILLAARDGMGGQGHGRTASRLASRSRAES